VGGEDGLDRQLEMRDARDGDRRPSIRGNAPGTRVSPLMAESSMKNCATVKPKATTSLTSPSPDCVGDAVVFSRGGICRVSRLRVATAVVEKNDRAGGPGMSQRP